MNIALLLFDGVVALDVVGPYEVLSRLPGVHVDLVAHGVGSVRSDTDFLKLTSTASFTDVTRPDVLVVPGGAHQIDDALQDDVLIEWVKETGAHAQWIAGIGSGTLILAQSGLLERRSATAHWTALERLESLGVRCSRDRIVIDDNILTASSSAAGIELALQLVDRLSNTETAQALRLFVGYPNHSKSEFETWLDAPAHVRQKAEHLMSLSLLREEGRSAIRRLRHS